MYGSVTKGIFWIPADGSGSAQPLTTSGSDQVPTSFSPDGKHLAFTERGRIWILPLENQAGQWKAGQAEPWHKDVQSTDERAAQFSPDGRWMAYDSSTNGKREVYVEAFQPASGVRARQTVSSDGGQRPVWSAATHELLYESGDRIMAVSYTVQGDHLVLAKPRVWTAKRGGTNWDLAADGKRVVIVAPVEAAEDPKQEHEVTFLFNFFDELRRRAPPGK